MPIVFIVVALVVPRILMAMIFLMSDYFSRGFSTWLWPVLGFVFMPYTTITYLAAMLMNRHELTGIWLALLITAVVFDAAHWAGGSRTYRRRWCGAGSAEGMKSES